MVINKPSGLLSHPNGFEKKISVVNQLAYYWSTKLKNTTLIRNGLVHRLDQNTSGLMLVAKNNHSLSHLLGQFANRTITKKYYALIVGKLMAPHLRVNVPIGKSSSGQLKMVANGGKNQKIAISLIEEVEQFTNHSLVRCQLLTGRTHQIRVHLSYLKCPIVNDPLYGNGNYLADNYGQYLHAYYLKFIHPVSGQTIELTVPWDQVFEQQYQRLKH